MSLCSCDPEKEYNPSCFAHGKYEQLRFENARLKDELALAQSDTSVKHKYRADVLERQCDRLQQAVEVLREGLENLHFYCCTACEDNMEVRDNTLARADEILKGGKG